MRIQLLVFFIILLVFSGCEDFFTASPLEGFRRDPSSLSEGAKLSLAVDAISSGDTDTMNQLIDSMEADIQSGNASPEVNAAAVDLVIGTTGVQDAVTDLGEYADVLAGGGSVDPATAISAVEDLAASINTENVDVAVQALTNLEASGNTADSDDYLMVAVAMAAGAVTNDAGVADINVLDNTSPEYAALTPEEQQDITDLNDFVTDSVNTLYPVGSTVDPDDPLVQLAGTLGITVPGL